MLCKNFDSLNTVDKVIFIGQLCHAVQSDDKLFEFGQKIIQLGEVSGLFNGVTILPKPVDDGQKED